MKPWLGHERAFTLIELPVVIALQAVLKFLAGKPGSETKAAHRPKQ